MFDRSVLSDGTSGKAQVARSIQALHERCGIYTNASVVRRILDSIGWTACADLSKSRLLEPAAGDGAFVIEAAERLIRSLKSRRIRLVRRNLVPRIAAYELHPREARRARARIRGLLRKWGVGGKLAGICARAWVMADDFLLSKIRPDSFTHVVANPPYVRWSNVPRDLRSKYAQALPHGMARGDLFLPFLHRALEALAPEGKCGFLCSDRWRYMRFGEAFRRTWLPRLEITSETALHAREAFVQLVGSYPTILVARKRAEERRSRRGRRRTGKTLAELGCVVRVGPALGHTDAYVLDTGQTPVERGLTKRWIDSKDIRPGRIEASGRRVIAMHNAAGRLIAVSRYPTLYRRLRRFRSELKRRYHVRNGGAKWYSPIDRVRAADWQRPKILIPEMAKWPRAAIDRSGAIPSHGVYAIFCRDDDVEAIYRRLRGRKLAQALKGVAPRVKGGYYRCYRRFLEMIRV